jgi:carbamoyl-phosphate synthase large subunit
MNALVVAGGQWQVPLIEFLKKKGFCLYVVDPYDNSSGVLIADHHIKADVRDAECIVEQMADIPFELITTDQSDISVETVAVLCKKTGLFGNSVDAVRTFSNKYLSREYAKKENIPIPKFSMVKNLREVEEFIRENGLPAIIKPCDSQSSKGIHKITGDNLKQIPAFIEDALTYSKQDGCLAETFVYGYEITAEGYCSDGKHKTLAISKKKHFRTGIASSLSYPAVLPRDMEERIIEINDKYVENSGLKFGITHAEYMIDETKREINLIEIACRGGGTLISSDIIKRVSGFDVYEALYSDLRGKSTSVKDIVPLKRNAILHFFEFPSGKVKKINGLDEVKSMEGVLTVDLNFSIGDTLGKAKDDRGRQGFVILFADSLDEQNERLNLITKMIQIEYEQ